MCADIRMTTDQELQSFFTKFMNISSAGFKAQLNVSTEQGEVSVSLNVDLGKLSACAEDYGYQHLPRPRPPSYFRRQVRRRMNKTVEMPSPSERKVDVAVMTDICKNADEESTIITEAAKASVLLEKHQTQDQINYEEIKNQALTTIQPNDNDIKSTLKQRNSLRAEPSSIEPMFMNSGMTSTVPKEIELPKFCCEHIHRPGTPPPDGTCCYHRCRPTWTLEERERHYGKEVFSIPKRNYNHPSNLARMKD